MTDIWHYRVDLDVPDIDLAGFDVEANDGHIGKVDRIGGAVSATVAGLDDGIDDGAGGRAGFDDSYLVVDTGFWIFGKRRVIPARAVKQVNAETQQVFVDLTKEQIRDAPDDDVDRDAQMAYYLPFVP